MALYFRNNHNLGKKLSKMEDIIDDLDNDNICGAVSRISSKKYYVTQSPHYLES